MTARHWTQSHGSIPHEIDPDRYPSITAMMDEAMERYADKVAFNCFGQTLTYAQVGQLSGAFCTDLQHTMGIQKGDRVAVMLPTLAAFSLALLGIIRAGAVQVNVNLLYTPRELEHQLNGAGCDAIVIFSGSTPTPAEGIARTPVKTMITAGLGEGLELQLPCPALDKRLTQTVPFTTALAEVRRWCVCRCTWRALTPCFCSTRAAPRVSQRAQRSPTATWWPTPSSSRPFMAGAVRAGDEVVVTAVPPDYIVNIDSQHEGTRLPGHAT